MGNVGGVTCWFGPVITVLITALPLSLSLSPPPPSPSSALDKGEDPAHLCDVCLDKMHSTLGKFAATHHVTSIALQEVNYAYMH